MLWKIILTAPAEQMATLDSLFEEAESTCWFERSPFDPLWQFEALVKEKPLEQAVTALLHQHNLSSIPVNIEQVAPQNWLAENRKTFQPIEVGPFFIHDSYFTERVPEHRESLVIDAATAFGTGHHETTRFCLQLMLQLHEEGCTFKDILDLGCGTGILGMAAYRLWHASVLLTDNDPEAIERTQGNLRVNNCQGACLVAEGFHHITLLEKAPFDLIVANILAQPLIDMAGAMATCLKKGGYCILSGLLLTQAPKVIQAYEALGFTVVNHLHNNLWSGLLLKYQE